MTSFLANTLGVLYRAAYGTVDPWTKQQLIDQEAADLEKASGGQTDASTAQSQAQADVTGYLVSVKADPSQSSFLGSAGIAGLLSGTQWIVTALIVGGIVYIFWKAGK